MVCLLQKRCNLFREEIMQPILLCTDLGVSGLSSGHEGHGANWLSSPAHGLRVLPTQALGRPRGLAFPLPLACHAHGTAVRHWNTNFAGDAQIRQEGKITCDWRPVLEKPPLNSRRGWCVIKRAAKPVSMLRTPWAGCLKYFSVRLAAFPSQGQREGLIDTS